MPLKLRDKLKIVLEIVLKIVLDRVENAEIIRKVYKPTKWVNALVLVSKKDGGLRVCLDPYYLNREIQKGYYYIPFFENLCSKMSGAVIFSTLDADKAF